MGLAASQARLLTLTSRSIDLELQCMRFSAQQIRSAQKACELSEDYNTKLDWLQDRYDASQKAQADAANSYDMVSLSTISYAQLNSYGITVNPVSNSGNANSDGSFNMNSIPFANYIKLVPGQSFDSPQKYAEKAMSFIASYGSSNFHREEVDITSVEYARSKGVDDKEYNQVRNYFNNSSRKNDSNPSALMSEFYPHIGKDATHIGEMHSLLQEYYNAYKSGNNKKTVYKNERGVEQDTWNRALTSAAAGLNRSAFEQCVKNGGSITDTQIQQYAGKYTVGYIDGQTFNGYFSAEGAARNNYKKSPEYQQYENNLNNSDSINERSKAAYADLANHPEKLWDYVNAGLLTLVGPEGQINDPQSYGVAKQSDTPVDVYDKDQLKSDQERLEREYDSATKRLEVEDKRLQAQMTQVQTELNACNQEIQSVKTLIDKNVERGFSYGYNA